MMNSKTKVKTIKQLEEELKYWKEFPAQNWLGKWMVSVKKQEIELKIKNKKGLK